MRKLNPVISDFQMVCNRPAIQNASHNLGNLLNQINEMIRLLDSANSLATNDDYPDTARKADEYQSRCVEVADAVRDAIKAVEGHGIASMGAHLHNCKVKEGREK